MQLTLTKREAAAVHHALTVYERWLRGLVWIGHGVTPEADERVAATQAVTVRIENQIPELKPQRNDK